MRKYSGNIVKNIPKAITSYTILIKFSFCSWIEDVGKIDWYAEINNLSIRLILHVAILCYTPIFDG